MDSQSELPTLVEDAKRGDLSPSEFRRRLSDAYVFVLSSEPVRDLVAIVPVTLVINNVTHLAAFSSLSAADAFIVSFPYYGKVKFRAALASIPADCGLVLDPGSISGFAMSPVQIDEWRELPRTN